MKRKPGLIILALLWAALCLAGCGQEEPPESAGRFNTLEDFSGAKVSSLTGTMFDQMLGEYIPDPVFEYYDDLPSTLLAVESGRADVTAQDEPVARLAVADNPALSIWGMLEADSYGLALPKGSPLTDQVSAIIEDFLSDGTMAGLQSKWFSGDEDLMKVDIPEYEAANGVLRYSHDFTTRPMSYVDSSGNSQGFEVELVLLIGKELGMEVVITQTRFASLISDLQGGKADIVSGSMSITGERRQSVDFATSHYQGGVVLLIRTADMPTQRQVRFSQLSDFVDKKIAIFTGGMYGPLLQEAVGEVQLNYYDDLSSQILALTSGAVDAVALDDPLARLAVIQWDGLMIFDQPIGYDDYGLLLPKDSPLTDPISAIIEGYLSDGTIAELERKWFSGDEALMKVEVPEYEAVNGVLRYSHDSTSLPMSYVDGAGHSQGLEVELVLLIGQELGMEVEITQTKFNTLISDIQSGRADIASGAIAITEERQQSMDFPTPFYSGEVVLVINERDGLAAAEDDGPEQSFWQQLKDSFYKTFIKEARWKLIVRGLGVTALVAVAAAVIGTPLSLLIYTPRTCKYPWVRRLTADFISVIQSLPVVVLLMILYYLVFKGLDINAVLISIIGIALNFAVYVAEMLRSGVNAVPRGQSEAAWAIGFNQRQTFLKVVLPQAVRHILPVYRGEFISMLKTTAMVGYIAVQDLTKVGDIIRSNTYEAFFPLISVAILYFLLAYALTSLISLAEFRLDPARRKRAVKGVRS